MAERNTARDLRSAWRSIFRPSANGVRLRRGVRLIEGMRLFEDIRAEEHNGTNVTGVEAALAATGLDYGPTRPLSTWPPTVLQQDELVRFLSDNGLV